MYQEIMLIGNLGREPEMRYLPNGNAITNFSIATSRKWKDANGQPKEETLWWRISTFGKLAELCNQYCVKGSRVLVKGEMTGDEKTGSPRVFQRKDGTSGASFEVRANLVRFLSGKSEQGTDESTNDGVTEIPETDLPF